jgi:hypothetical protein
MGDVGPEVKAVLWGLGQDGEKDDEDALVHGVYILELAAKPKGVKNGPLVHQLAPWSGGFSRAR